MYLVFRGRNCKPDKRTVVFNGTDLQSVQDAVHLGHHVSTFNKDRSSTALSLPPPVIPYTPGYLLSFIAFIFLATISGDTINCLTDS